jgi:hypothetical protein
MDPTQEPAPLVEATAEGQAEEEDEFDREPSHLVFVVHGIGEKMWASDAIQVCYNTHDVRCCFSSVSPLEQLQHTITPPQGMLSLRASVEVMRTNVMQQQVRVMEEELAAPTAACSKKGSGCRKGKDKGGEEGECDASHTSAAASGNEEARTPSEEATGAFETTGVGIGDVFFVF